MMDKTLAKDRYSQFTQDHFDAVVIGAGIGGLTTAALLARRGLSVLVLEMHYELGGCATVFNRRGKGQGYQFDVGLHYVGDCERGGLIPRILDAAGVDPIQFVEQDPDGFDNLYFPDFEFKIPRGVEKFRERMKEAFPAEAKGIDRYLTMLQQVWALMGFNAAPLRSLHVLPRCLLALRNLNTTVADFLDTCTKDPQLRAVLTGQLGVYHQPPSRATLMGHAGVSMHFLQGSFYPSGGGQVLSDRLAESIEASGGKILLRSKVTRIVTEKGRVTGVEFSSPLIGTHIVRTPIVVSNADLKHTMLELLEGQDLLKKTREKVKNYEMSPAMGIVYLGVKRDFHAEGWPNANLRIYPSYDFEKNYDDCRRQQFSEQPHVFVGNASLKDPNNPDVAPEGVANLQLMSLAPSSFEAWKTTEDAFRDGSYRKQSAYLEMKERFADSLIRETERVLKGISGQIVYKEIGTPLTLMRYTGASNGTSYGMSFVPSQFMHHRPGPKTELRGLYICGASTRSGHGIFGAMSSGVEACAAILGGRVRSDVFSKSVKAAV